MESLAMGTPVIASTARGNAELVENNGRIVEIGDVPALAEALDELARDAGLARRLGATARARIVERYAIGGIIERHLAMYEGILARRAQSGAPPATGSTVPARPRARRGVDGSDSS